MELRFVISTDLYPALSQNLEKTYWSIAKGILGTENVTGTGWKAVTNAFEHPICNFAFCEDGKKIDTEALVKLAGARPFFNVYVIRYGTGEGAYVDLDRAGFVRVYSLAVMTNAKAGTGAAGKLRFAPTAMDRHRLADFMMWQFFSTQSANIRDRIAQATVRSAELQLYDLERPDIRERPVAAVMLHRTDSVLGLYNLCVSVPYRSRGFGSSIVFAVEQLAMQERVILELQCDPALIDWYQALGLEQVGAVDVYGLQKSHRF